MENEKIPSFISLDDYSIPPHIFIESVQLRAPTAKKKAGIIVFYQVLPSLSVKRKEKMCSSEISKSEEDNFVAAFQLALTSILADNPAPEGTPVILSPLKTRPQNQNKDKLPTSIKRSLGNSWGGSRPGSGKLTSAEKKKRAKRIRTIKKLAVFRKSAKNRAQRKVKKEAKLIKLTQKMEGYVSVLEACLVKAEFAPIFNQAIGKASAFQIGKLANQANALLTYYKTYLGNIEGPKYFIIETVVQQVPLKLSTQTLRKWISDFETNGGKFSECRRGKFERRWILNQEDLKNRACNFIRDFPSDNGRYIVIEDFQMFLNNDLLPNSGLDLKQTYGLSIPISCETARVWMHSLGFTFSDVKKDIYYDGHD